MKKILLYTALVILYLLHNDLWYWNDSRLIFGIPIGLSYHILYCIVSVVVLWIYFYVRAGNSDTYTVGGTGVMPVAVILAASTAAMILVSLMTRPPDPLLIEKFFPSEHRKPEMARIES